MKNRKSIIAGAILSIMLCVSIVAGATFALFETKDEINVSVGSANVKITATIGDLETYSYDATENARLKPRQTELSRQAERQPSARTDRSFSTESLRAIRLLSTSTSRMKAISKPNGVR